MNFVQPDMRPISENRYELMQPYPFNPYPGYVRIVPRGFISDGASVPRLLWPILRPDGLIRAAALVHDYMYKRHDIYFKRDADDTFLKYMELAGVKKYKRVLAYWAVRVFGKM